ncbi:MAG: hypothetical protein WBE79_07125 [Candidatus Cybelea sp.]
MLARPATIAAMPSEIASRSVHGSAATRIVARSGLRCERLASMTAHGATSDSLST